MKTHLAYTPNTLTLLRVVLGVCVFLLLVARAYSEALLLLLFALSTDYVDGALARTFDARSHLGTEILEPIADSTLTAGTCLGILLLTNVPLPYILLLLFVALGYVGIRNRFRLRLLALRKTVEPTLYAIIGFLLAIWIAFQVSTGWVIATVIFFLAFAAMKFRRIRYYLTQRQDVQETKKQAN